MMQEARIKLIQSITVIGIFCMLISPLSYAADNTAINFWYGDTQNFGQQGNPQNWVNVLGNISQTNVSDVRSTVKGGYSVNGGETKSLAIGTNGNRLVSFGDFNIGIDHAELREGANLVKVTILRKSDDVELASKTATINYTHGNRWPFPYTADWGRVNNIQDIGKVGQIVDGLWEPVSEGIRVVTKGNKGYDLTIAIGDETWPTDYEVTVPFISHTASKGIGFAFGWQGHTYDSSDRQNHPPIQWPLQALAWVRGDKEIEILTYDGPKRPGGGGWEKSLIKEPLASHQRIKTGKKYFLKARSKSIANSNFSQVYFKLWAEGEGEPSDWMINATAPTRKGSILLVAYDVKITFGNITVSRLGADVEDNTPPTISNITQQVTDTKATISWDTNKASDSQVNYGFNGNNLWSTNDPQLVLNHKVTLSDLVPDSQYNYQIASSDLFGNTTKRENLSFNTTNNGIGETGLLSDEFTGHLNTNVWEAYDPLGDSDFLSTSRHFNISVPAGTRHDLWKNALNAPRIRQTVTNTDFQVDVKFDSSVSTKYQMQGITVEQDNNNLLRLGMFSDGAETYLFSASFINGNPTVQINTAIPVNTSYLRVKRSGDQWTLSYSADGATWLKAGDYTHSIVANKVGLYAGNASSPAPAHTASIDSFIVEGASFVGDNSNPDEPIDSGSGVSDNFEHGINTTRWSSYTPLGDSSITTTDTQLSIAVPAGTSHDLWTGKLNAPRLTQPVTNTDFELEAKFDSTVSAKYQLQGIIVEQDRENLLRFEFHSDGSSTNVFAASIVDGSAKKRLLKSINIGSPSYLKVTRTGEQWTVNYSSDGLTWHGAGSFSHNLTVTSAGIFAGNNGSPAPAHTALIDYFKVNDSAFDGGDSNPTPEEPIDTNNASSDDFDGVLNTAIWDAYEPLGDSSITTTGSQLKIAIPAGTKHDLWTGKLNAPRLTQSITNTDFDLEAKFDSAVTAKYQLQGIVVEQDHQNLLRFEFHHNGETTNVYAAKIVDGNANQTALKAISPGASYLRVTRVSNQWTVSYSYDGSSWESAGGFSHDLTANTAGLFAGNSGNPAPAHTALIDYFKVNGSSTTNNGNSDPTPEEPTETNNTHSDDFNGSLNTAIWNLYQPLADTSITTTGSQLKIAIPAGTGHDLWTDRLNAPRLTQLVTDSDFEIEAKFDSVVTAKYQLQGLVVEQDHENLLRFEFHSNGSTTNVFAAKIVNGEAKQTLMKSINTAAYLRVTRNGNQWTLSYSYNGSNWESAGSFSHDITVNTAGLFAGTSGNPAPAHTALVDYFKLTDL